MSRCDTEPPLTPTRSSVKTTPLPLGKRREGTFIFYRGGGQSKTFSDRVPPETTHPLLSPGLLFFFLVDPSFLRNRRESVSHIYREKNRRSKVLCRPVLWYPVTGRTGHTGSLECRDPRGPRGPRGYRHWGQRPGCRGSTWRVREGPRHRQDP